MATLQDIIQLAQKLPESLHEVVYDYLESLLDEEPEPRRLKPRIIEAIQKVRTGSGVFYTGDQVDAMMAEWEREDTNRDEFNTYRSPK